MSLALQKGEFLLGGNEGRPVYTDPEQSHVTGAALQSSHTICFYKRGDL